MSSLMEMLAGQLSGGNLDQLGSALGTDRDQTGKAVSAALPMLLGALSRNATKGEGAQSLNRALEKDHDGSLLDNLSGFLGQGNTSSGDAILKHVLGGKRQTVETGLSQSTGLGSDGTGKLLAMLAPVVMGALGKQRKEQNLDASGLASMLGQERESITKQVPEMGMLEGLLDSDGDGDVDAGDLMRGLGKLGKMFGSGR